METLTRGNLLTVKVDGWSNLRDVLVRPDNVALELTQAHCQHCSTCSSRLEHVRSVFGPDFPLERHRGSLFVMLPYGPDRPRDVESIAQFLSKALQLRIHPR